MRKEQSGPVSFSCGIAISWTAGAIEAAAGIHTNACVAGKTLATNSEVISALSSFQSKISNLHMPTIPATKTPSSYIRDELDTIVISPGNLRRHNISLDFLIKKH